MNKQINDELKDKLNKIQLKGLEGIFMGQALCLPIDTVKRYSIIKNYLKILFHLIFGFYTYDMDRNGSIVFFSSRDNYKRVDYRLFFDQVQKLTKSRCYIYPGIRRIKLEYVPVLQWIKVMKKKNISKNEIFFVIPYIIEGYKCIKYIISIINQPKLFVVISDFQPIESIVLQYFNKGVDSVSLQHGNYGIKNPIFEKNNPAKYMLIYGSETKKVCCQLGINENKLRVVGMPQLIYRKVKTKLRTEKKYKFGVIFDGGSYCDVDEKIFEIAKKISIIINMDFLVKLHPGTGTENYGIKNELINHIDNNLIKIENFLENVDFIIVCDSTVMIEALIEMIPVYCFGFEREHFSETNNLFSFRNADEFIEIYKYNLLNKKYLEECMINKREQLTNTIDVKSKYREFFKSYDL